MSKKTLPDIAADLDEPPRLILPPGGEMPDLSDAQVEAGTAKLKQMHQTHEPASRSPTPAVTEAGEGGAKSRQATGSVETASLFARIPADLMKQINRAAFEAGGSKSYIVCKALAQAGFDVNPAFLVPDRRSTN